MEHTTQAVEKQRPPSSVLSPSTWKLCGLEQSHFLFWVVVSSAAGRRDKRPHKSDHDPWYWYYFLCRREELLRGLWLLKSEAGRQERGGGRGWAAKKQL